MKDLREFHGMLLKADPEAGHYESTSEAENYTVWTEYDQTALCADDRRDMDYKWKIQVDRFTTIEFDPMVDAISAALDNDRVAFHYQVDYEKDTKTIHHMWLCEVV